MESKKTFGAYILKRRKELGMTQKEFAEKLYVTESAVSKWERGLSYPDITLLRAICGVLDISEHELLTGSEDTKKRASERMAAKYQRLTRNYRISQYVLYGLILLGCAIGNLASAGRLDWFFIAVAGVMMGASLTLLPALAALHPGLSRHKAALSAVSFFASLELLLLICCIYTKGTWFPMAGISVLFGGTLVLLPFVLPTLPLPASLAGRKSSLYLGLEMALLLLLLLIACMTTGGDWFLLTAVSVVFGLGFLILPVFLRQLPIPLPLSEHKVLLYFVIQTALLFLVEFTASYPETMREFGQLTVPITLLGLTLPWGIMGICRYVPVNWWLRLSGSCFWASLWLFLFPPVLDRIMWRIYGEPEPGVEPLGFSWLRVDFFTWDEFQTPLNVFALVTFGFLGLGLLLAGMGIWKGRKKELSKGKIVDKTGQR